MAEAGRVWVIDNYDSFTYNLVQYLAELGTEPVVVRNDAVPAEELLAAAPAGVVISPGPCTPDQAGISLRVVELLGPSTPLLGVCLGHQAIGQACGGRVVRAPKVMHGKVSAIWHDGSACLRDLPSPFNACRYHSLVVERGSLPKDLVVTAWTDDGLVMGLRHRRWPVEGVQFHPEAILTEHGHRLLANWLGGLGRHPSPARAAVGGASA